MAADQRVVIPYSPRPLQLEIHRQIEAKRWWVAVAHRRFGKTVLAVNHLIKRALTCSLPRPRVAYIAPTYTQGKTIAWDYIKHYGLVIPGTKANESELRLDFPNGGQIRIYGADNPDSLRGIYLDDVVLDEYGMMPRTLFSEVLRPALSDRKGRAGFIGTPAGRNQFYDVAQSARTDTEWYFGEFKASETNLLNPGELASARKTMTADEYAQEFECSFEASVKGAIYADALSDAREAKRIGRVPYSPEMPVNTYWDLGVGDATAIWFVQGVASEVRCIDYYEASGEGLPHYKKVLTERGYIYGQHWAPHDIEVREFSSGRSRLETAANLGIRFQIVPNVAFEDGIHAARVLLARTWFDAEKCRKGLDALGAYRWDFNSRLQEFKATPVHDWASHGADAFRYLAVAWRPYMTERVPEIPVYADGV